MAAEQSIEHNTWTPNIGFLPDVLLTLNKLRRRIAGWPASSRQFFVISVSVAQAKIDHFEVQLFIQQQVLRLDISVHDAQLPEVAYGWNQLLEESASFFLFELRLRGDVAEEFAVAAVLHNDVEPCWGLDDLVHLNNVGVAHYFENVDFPSDSLDVVYLCDFVFFEDFDCYFLLSEQMNSLLHLAEGALAEGLGHSVAADYLESLSAVWV